METTELIKEKLAAIEGHTKEIKTLLDLHAAPTPEPDFQDEKMTPEQAATFMKVHYETLAKYIRQGKIRCYGSRRKRFVLRSELIEDFKSMANGIR